MSDRRRGVSVAGTNRGSFKARARGAPDLQLTPDLEPDLAPDLEADRALAYLRAILDRPDDPGPEPDSSLPGSSSVGLSDLGDLLVDGPQMPPLTFSHTAALDVSKVEPVAMDHSEKPWRGLWLTVHDVADPRPTPWEGVATFRPREERPTVRTAVRLRPDARILKVTSPEDFDRVCAAFPNEPGWDAQWRETFDEPGRRPLDWVALSTQVDAIWCTDSAVDQAPGLAMWDFESVLVFHPDAVEA